jgi:hypothetical protein
MPASYSYPGLRRQPKKPEGSMKRLRILRDGFWQFGYSRLICLALLFGFARGEKPAAAQR